MPGAQEKLQGSIAGRVFLDVVELSTVIDVGVNVTAKKITDRGEDMESILWMSLPTFVFIAVIALTIGGGRQ